MVKMKKILILSFYYPPDLCPGSFRCGALVEALERQGLKDYQLEVMTTAPNRYVSFQIDALAEEKRAGLKIRRIRLPVHKSGMVDQSRAFLFFARQVARWTKEEDYCLVIASSSRLMTAVLGSLVARRKKIPLYLDIRDLFVDTLSDLFSKKLSFFLKPFFKRLEAWSFKRAKHINLISQGFESYIEAHYPQISRSFFSNGVDPAFVFQDFNQEEKVPTAPLTVLYAGNIGEGQGLHHILPLLAKRMENKVHFKIIGDGGRKEALALALTTSACKNVSLLPPLNRALLIQEYQAADILFLHLNDYAAFLKVLPSKIFEYAATAKPIWAGVAGYAGRFIQNEIPNAAVFPPCELDAAEASFALLELGNKDRRCFIEKYDRKKIMDKMAEHILLFLKTEESQKDFLPCSDDALR